MTHTSRRNFLGASGAVLAQALAKGNQLIASPLPSPEIDTQGETLVADLVIANHILANEGVLDGYGHVSARLASPPDAYLLSRSLAPELVAGTDLIQYSLESNPLHPEPRAQYLERFIHGEIYRARGRTSWRSSIATRLPSFLSA
jgi:Class II Aldolase and Adducin N-terminal domain